MLGALPESVVLKDGLQNVAQRVIDRLSREAPAERIHRLLTAMFVLLGLRVPRREAQEILKGTKAMRESDTYLAILDEGALAALREGVLRLGTKRFGPPDEATSKQLNETEDLEWMRRVHDSILDVKSWKELLATP